MSYTVFGSDAYVECKVGGNYMPVGCATGFQYTYTNETVGKTDANAGLFRKRRVRMSDLSATVSGLTTLTSDTSLSILYFMQEGVRRRDQDFRINFKDEAGTQRQIQFIAVIETIEITGDAVGFSESTLSVVGSGGFSITAVNPDEPTGAGIVLSDWWETTPGATSITGPGDYSGFSFASQRVIEVDREGVEYDEADTPGARTYSYDGTNINFDPMNPFNAGERVFVIWQIDNS